MNMSSIIPSIVLVLISILPCLGLAYEIETHSEMSAKALDASTLAKDPLVLKNLGLQTGQSFPDSNNIPSNIEVLFRTGARFEDNLSITNLRPINHFFDPTSEGVSLLVIPVRFRFYSLLKSQSNGVRVKLNSPANN